MTEKTTCPMHLSLEEAYDVIFRLPLPNRTEILPIEQTNGRILAQDIYANESVPPFSRAPLDGYAFIAADIATATAENPIQLQVIAETAAGDGPARPLHKGEAVRIMTGAPFPDNADTMVRYEDTEFTATSVKIFAPMASGKNKVMIGEDVAEGKLIATRGTKVSPPLIGLLAAVNHPQIEVYQKPIITIINTGDELVEPGQELPPGKIRNSSYYTLGRYIEEAGAIVINGGIVSDKTEPIAHAIDAALPKSDMIITTGGVSVGDFDMVRAATAAIEAEHLFWKVQLRPGGTLLAAQKDNKLILGLSGNPGSAAIGLHFVGMPYIRRLAGNTDIFPAKIKVTLLEDFAKESPHGRILRGSLVIKDGAACFTVAASQGNGIVSSLLNCDLIAEIPANTKSISKGMVVDAYWIRP